MLINLCFKTNTLYHKEHKEKCQYKAHQEKITKTYLTAKKQDGLECAGELKLFAVKN